MSTRHNSRQSQDLRHVPGGRDYLRTTIEQKMVDKFADDLEPSVSQAKLRIIKGELNDFMDRQRITRDSLKTLEK